MRQIACSQIDDLSREYCILLHVSDVKLVCKVDHIAIFIDCILGKVGLQFVVGYLSEYLRWLDYSLRE